MSFFSLPGRLKADDLKIKVVARRDGFLQEAKVEVAPIYLNQILVSTDKPLYQPGQTLRVRVLALDRDRKAGIEGILQRPYGCAEQTISSTYPNVMILRHLEPQSEKLSAPMRKIAEKARRYAQAGYERLLGYRAENGGFSYWGRGEADLALTAYALRFLNDASDFIGVDEDVIADARKFILGSQERDGGWAPRYWSEKEDAKRSALNTAFIARAPAMEKRKEAKADKDFAAALSRSLDYLAKRIEEIDEPYLIASYALAAMDAGEKRGAEKAVAKLRTLAREEAGTSYWNLESNTPFHGRELAGRIETTALSVNALKRAAAAEVGRAG